MKIIWRYSKDIGTDAPYEKVYFVVPMSANSLQIVFFASVSEERCADYIVSKEFVNSTY